MEKTISKVLVSAVAVSTLGMANAEAAPDLPQVTAGSSMSDLRQRYDEAVAEGIVDLGGSSVGELEKPKLELPDELKVQVNGFRVTGQNIFSEEKLLRLFKYEKGQLMTFGDLQAQADKLTDFFRKRGYLAARVYLPAQKINGGIVEYTVVVGKVGEITVNNYTHIRGEVLKNQVAFLKKNTYITRNSLERAVWLISDLAGADAKATLTPSAAPGLVDIVIDVNPNKAKKGLLYADNYGNRYSGYGELGLSYDFTNPTRSGDHLAINILRTNRDLYNGSLRYTVPIISDGLTASVGYSHVHYELGGEMSNLGAMGMARVYSAGIDYAIRRTSKNNLYLGVGYERSEIDDEYRNTGYKYADKTADIGMISLYGNERDGSGISVWRIDYRFGNLGFNTPLTHYFSDSTHSEGTYHKVKGQYMRRQDLNHRLSLYLTARAQTTSRNLDSYERMSLGGIAGVKAYPQSEASGDIGYFTRAELRWFIPLKARGQSLQLAPYIEHGTIWANRFNQSETGENRRRLQGIGIGLIWQKSNDWFLRADYAWRLGAEKVRADKNDAKGRFWIQGGVYF